MWERLINSYKKRACVWKSSDWTNCAAEIHVNTQSSVGPSWRDLLCSVWARHWLAVWAGYIKKTPNAQHKITAMRTVTTIVLNNTQVLCSVMKPFLPLFQAENNWNLGQWGTQERRGSQHFNTDRHLKPLTIVKHKQLVCTGLYWVIVRHVVN